VVATNNVHYATPARWPLATALAAVRSRRSLDEIDGWLPASGAACLRSGAEQARRFARYPGVVERAAEMARACAFDLRLVAPDLPDYPIPDGHTEMTWLRELTRRGAAVRYGPSEAERVPGCYDQIDHELALIKPDLVVALGATAAQSLLGKVVPITKLRGQVITREDDGLRVYLTVHPSFILRIPEPTQAADERMRFLNDLKQIKALMGA